MAAGLGSRLGELTRSLPKALIPVGGKTLLNWAVAFARCLAPSEIVIVGGYGFSSVQEEVAREGWDHQGKGVAGSSAATVRLVENQAFREGNILSLMAAKPYLTGEFLLMNVDHVYRPAMASRVGASAEDVTGMVDTDRRLGADDMKVARDEAGRIREISKTLTTFDAGYIGMTLVPGGAPFERYWKAVDSVIAVDGRTAHVEKVLARLVSQGTPPACRDLSGFGWLEVDTPDERTQAEAALARGGFDRPLA
jgi:choline kinase